jgi:uncharacterized protein YndB with AHSA1/START domain
VDPAERVHGPRVQVRAEGRGLTPIEFLVPRQEDTHFFGGKFLEIKPNERMRYTDKFESDDPEMQSEMRVTVTFKDVPGGTEVKIVQEGVPRSIPIEGAMLGWSQSLENLARLVEL